MGGKSNEQKNSASKYDFVKVRVHLSDQHYYVLSRFILCRMLTAARIDYGHALRMALDLKKRLVDKDRLDVSQQELQSELFALFQRHGYGEEHVQWYKTMADFHHERIPLVVLLAGTASIGKSTIATRLSERLNLSSVLKTDVIYDLMHTIMDGVRPPRLWTLDEIHFDRECALVCQGLDADLCKSVSDGKSIIIEGDLVSHALLKHLNQFEQQRVVVAPFLLTLSDADLHRDLVQDSQVFDRLRAWQDTLLAENSRKNNPKFNVIQVDLDNLQTSIDSIQAIVLERIAAQMRNI
ncbi:hypothetical protein EC973_006284 [Apophysomyces ossiformis]|uniref:2-phosphoglycerate kinase n=1 Tax=Apophysomyces ossiformis TaxID=679940 RepID=A0A8H7BRA3_9FUNG|nr:hypothetical protein EC973_006284 [Apophysomyces ossiformis]